MRVPAVSTITAKRRSLLMTRTRVSPGQTTRCRNWTGPEATCSERASALFTRVGHSRKGNCLGRVGPVNDRRAPETAPGAIILSQHTYPRFHSGASQYDLCSPPDAAVAAAILVHTWHRLTFSGHQDSEHRLTRIC
ncbi:hypothetical protein LSAT2_001362, partial [Lamellibrachia satsuma]